MINKFLSIKYTKTVDKIALIIVSFLIFFAWVKLFRLYGMQFFELGQVYQMSAEMSVVSTIIRACFFAPIWEELAFRYAPLQIAKGFDEKKFVLPVMIISSVLFGMIHGGPVNIFIQGIMGFIAGVIYVKSNYSFWTPLAFHALWNASVILDHVTQAGN